MFDTLKDEESQNERLHSDQLKHQLLVIFCSQKALWLVVLSMISFALSTYYVLMISRSDILRNYALEQSINLPPIRISLIISVIISALTPLFLLFVYKHAKQDDAFKVAKWINYAHVYFQISFVLMLIIGSFATLSMIGVVFVRPVLGMLLMMFMAASFGLISWVTWLIIKFLKTMYDNLTCEIIQERANPTSAIIATWIATVSSFLSITSGSFQYENIVISMPIALLAMFSRLTLVVGIVGLAISIILLLILYEIRHTFTNRP